MTPYETMSSFESLYAACRKGKGTSFAIRRLKGFLCEHYWKHGTDGWVLKIDVRKYFDSIDHGILKKRLGRFPDDGVRGLLCSIIDSHNVEAGRGLPLGNQSSQWFALYYLDPLDRMVKERLRIRHYTRHMDDMVLVHPSKEYLARCQEELRAFAREELGLEFNEKTQLAPLAQGVNYLGSLSTSRRPGRWSSACAPPASEGSSGSFASLKASLRPARSRRSRRGGPSRGSTGA